MPIKLNGERKRVVSGNQWCTGIGGSIVNPAALIGRYTFHCVTRLSTVRILGSTSTLSATPAISLRGERRPLFRSFLPVEWHGGGYISRTPRVFNASTRNEPSPSMGRRPCFLSLLCEGAARCPLSPQLGLLLMISSGSGTRERFLWRSVFPGL